MLNIYDFFHDIKIAIFIILFCKLNKYSNLHDTQEIMQGYKKLLLLLLHSSK